MFTLCVIRPPEICVNLVFNMCPTLEMGGHMHLCMEKDKLFNNYRYICVYLCICLLRSSDVQ